MILYKNNKPILYDLEIGDTFFKKFKGLMFKKEINDDYCLVLKCNAIHTFFMKTKIDVIMLDRYKKVIYMKENIKQNRIVLNFKARYTLELKPGTIQRLKIKNGDILEWGKNRKK